MIEKMDLEYEHVDNDEIELFNNVIGEWPPKEY